MRGKKAKAIRKYIYRGMSSRDVKYVQEPESAKRNKATIEEVVKEAARLGKIVTGWGTVYATGFRRAYRDGKKQLKLLKRKR